MINHRTGAWLAWMKEARSRLLTCDFGNAPPETAGFFANHYAGHHPTKFRAPDCPALGWSRETLEERAGSITVEVQAGRASNPDFELDKVHHRREMTFREFLGIVYDGAPNDAYLTANNSAANWELNAALCGDLMPLPPMLRPNPHEGMLWIGRQTMTPFHHDLTQNLLVQLVGRKRVRVAPPSQHHLYDNHSAVFSTIRWLSDEIIRERGIAAVDYWLEPGDAMLLPVGWWHCVDTPGMSITATWTNFPWDNAWTAGFPPG